MKLTDAKAILRSLGLPGPQQNDMSGHTLLARARIGPTTKWSEAAAVSHTIRKGIMDYVRDEYGRAYAENTRCMAGCRPGLCGKVRLALEKICDGARLEPGSR